MAKPRVCVDCRSEGITTKRPAPNPGPRCASHHRARRAKTRSTAWESRLMKTYSLSPEQYWAVYEAQGRKCAICQRATGASRRLSVDHDHSCCNGPVSCGKCVRSLLCSTCNKLLGHIRDDVQTAERIKDYLLNPPGRRVLDRWP
ncbi:endonuclease VII domain-containing protein [Mycobacteroides abscessus subsp. abscessus]|nr:endonuclease VII [Mycobacterium phage prophiGD43A-4]QSN28554.1 endonuclease VII domain-containing protein [Mycobacteroides abscessus subsp. abscessus]QSN33856.1 endonuclease VII domain-containing protein [Mycobacteroides abscessus subsp. abscessus]